MTTQTIKNHINKNLSKLPTYHESIPLDEILAVVRGEGMAIVQEDDEQWSGIICGENGDTKFRIIGIGASEMWLRLSWYKMASGRFEITTYVS